MQESHVIQCPLFAKMCCTATIKFNIKKVQALHYHQNLYCTATALRRFKCSMILHYHQNLYCTATSNGITDYWRTLTSSRMKKIWFKFICTFGITAKVRESTLLDICIFYHFELAKMLDFCAKWNSILSEHMNIDHILGIHIFDKSYTKICFVCGCIKLISAQSNRF